MRRVWPGLLLIVLTFAPSSFAAAQATAPTTAPASTSGTAALTLATKQIEITLRGSRLQVVAGSGFGIWADIKNISNGPVFLNPKFLTMTPPSEVSRADGPQDWASVMSGSFWITTTRTTRSCDSKRRAPRPRSGRARVIASRTSHGTRGCGSPARTGWGS